MRSAHDPEGCRQILPSYDRGQMSLSLIIGGIQHVQFGRGNEICPYQYPCRSAVTQSHGVTAWLGSASAALEPRF